MMHTCLSLLEILMAKWGDYYPWSHAVYCMSTTHLMQSPACHERHVHVDCRYMTHVHVVKALVDFLELLIVGNKLVNHKSTRKIVCHQSQLTTSSPSAPLCIEVRGISPSTIPGISDRPLTPPKADPRQTRPVTSWNLGISNPNQFALPLGLPPII